jgi:hypothetical protein
MTTVAMREQLMTYLANADDNKLKALYTILEDKMDENEPVSLTQEQISILEDEDKLHFNGASKSYNWEEAKQIIRGQRPL